MNKPVLSIDVSKLNSYAAAFKLLNGRNFHSSFHFFDLVKTKPISANMIAITDVSICHAGCSFFANIMTNTYVGYRVLVVVWQPSNTCNGFSPR